MNWSRAVSTIFLTKWYRLSHKNRYSVPQRTEYTDYEYRYRRHFAGSNNNHFATPCLCRWCLAALAEKRPTTITKTATATRQHDLPRKRRPEKFVSSPIHCAFVIRALLKTKMCTWCQKYTKTSRSHFKHFFKRRVFHFVCKILTLQFQRIIETSTILELTRL